MENQIEIWKDVVDYESYYEVSNLSNVRGKDRFIKYKSGKIIFKKSKLLSPSMSGGYLNVGLCKNGIVKRYGVHRLVAMMFIKNPENKKEVNHKNGIKTDNLLKNLEWCTPKENSAHAIKKRLINPSNGSSHYRAKLTEIQILEIRRLKPIMKTKEISKMYNIKENAVRRISNKTSWKHVK